MHRYSGGWVLCVGCSNYSHISRHGGVEFMKLRDIIEVLAISVCMGFSVTTVGMLIAEVLG